MKCFIHNEVEAVAACRKCGKGMCQDCSAYSGHTGICPECRRQEFILEATQKKARIVELEKKRKWNIAKTVLLFWTLHFLYTGVRDHCRMKKELESLRTRVATLDTEIARLTKHMQTNGKEFR